MYFVAGSTFRPYGLEAMPDIHTDRMAGQTYVGKSRLNAYGRRVGIPQVVTGVRYAAKFALSIQSGTTRRSPVLLLIGEKSTG